MSRSGTGRQHQLTRSCCSTPPCCSGTTLREHWDEVIYLDVAIERAQARGIARDADGLGGPDAAAMAYETRYMAACNIYLAEQNPRERASIVIEHDDPENPRVVRV